MRRHGRKRPHTQVNNSTFKDKNKAPDMHANNDQILKELILQYYEEETRKHKKKCKNQKLTLWEGLILLLLLKEKGILDELLETDEFDGFNENEYKEFNINSKHKSNKEKEYNVKEHYAGFEDSETHGIKHSSKKEHFDFDYFAED
ncbi:hypothetical protein [Ruminiclostridium cellobioparum]|uniref:hypothetical protein n=1 Tax=Ruminiclostridium cellobioparum TaxID=29355 RepID=UPI000481180F|nr:hypothetical protein [Ruminiclostridium cellobioparum]